MRKHIPVPLTIASIRDHWYHSSRDGDNTQWVRLSLAIVTNHSNHICRRTLSVDANKLCCGHGKHQTIIRHDTLMGRLTKWTIGTWSLNPLREHVVLLGVLPPQGG